MGRPMYVGVEGTLRMISVGADRGRSSMMVSALAGSVAGWMSGRDMKIRAIVTELNRRFVYLMDPLKEYVGPIPFEQGTSIDVDDACLFVAALARSLGIPCQIVGAQCDRRYWTCLVAYQDEEGFWTGVYPLRQSIDHIVVHELLFAEGK